MTDRPEPRSKRGDALRRVEGTEAFDAGQRFLDTAARLARERRLTRLVYLAQKPSELASLSTHTPPL
ncbi:MAG: hypothetical protein JF885_04395 [Candidatus Dormibacteraeota bacterium]|nr:hypothetical protein [Candidatus Dormibacteraeota bacterium]